MCEKLFRSPSLFLVRTLVCTIIKGVGVGDGLLHASHHIQFLPQFLTFVPFCEVQPLHHSILHLEEVSPCRFILGMLCHKVIPIVINAVQPILLRKKQFKMLILYFFGLLCIGTYTTCCKHQQYKKYLFHFFLLFVGFLIVLPSEST